MEYFDVYNEKKEKTGVKYPRKGTKLVEGEYQLIVLALIERADHRFLVTKRSMDKKWAAGAWEVSGGGVQAGETSFEGVCREVIEETGLDVKNAAGEMVYTYSNTDLESGDNYFVDIYHFHMDFDEKDVKIDNDETIDFKIATVDEIKALFKTDGFMHYQRILEAFDAEGYDYK